MRNNIIDLSLLLCFRTIYQTLNISKAGERLKLSKASVSKKLMALEDELGGKLFVRNTRKLSPTKGADILFSKVDLLLSAAADLNSVFNERTVLRGQIRITAPQSMAVSFLGKCLLEFQKKNPEVEIELVSNDRVLDVIEENIDLSIRVNPPKDSSLVGKKVGEYRLSLVATPKYLQKNPLKCIKGLEDHQFMSIPAHLNAWKAKIKLPPFKKTLTSNDSMLIGHLIRSGLAIGLRSNWDISSDLKDGKLVEALPSHASQVFGDVWLLAHASRSKLARVQALSSFLENELKHILA